MIERCEWDSNPQVFSDQRFSRPLPHQFGFTAYISFFRKLPTYKIQYVGSQTCFMPFTKGVVPTADFLS